MYTEKFNKWWPGLKDGRQGLSLLGIGLILHHAMMIQGIGLMILTSVLILCFLGSSMFGQYRAALGLLFLLLLLLWQYKLTWLFLGLLLFLVLVKRLIIGYSQQSKEFSIIEKLPKWTWFLSEEWQAYLFDNRQAWYADRPLNWRTHLIVNWKTLNFVVVEVFYKQSTERIKQRFQPLYKPRFK